MNTTYLGFVAILLLGIAFFAGRYLEVLVSLASKPKKNGERKDFEFPKREPYIYETVFIRYPGAFLFKEFDSGGRYVIKLGIEHDKSPCGNYLRIAELNTESLEVERLFWCDKEKLNKLTP